MVVDNLDVRGTGCLRRPAEADAPLGVDADALSWVDGTRSACPSYGCFFGRLKGLFLRLDLAVAGRRAEGLSGIAAGDRTCGA